MMFFALISRMTFTLLFILILSLALWQIIAYDARYFDTVRAELDFRVGCDFEPCYMGISLGETPVEDAVTLVQEQYDNPNFFNASYYLNGQQSFGLRRFSWARDEAPFITGNSTIEASNRNGIVWWVAMDTTLTMGDLWLAFGQPDLARVSNTFHTAQFGDFWARIPTDCENFWHQSAQIILTTHQMQGESPEFGMLRRQACDERLMNRRVAKRTP